MFDMFTGENSDEHAAGVRSLFQQGGYALGGSRATNPDNKPNVRMAYLGERPRPTAVACGRACRAGAGAVAGPGQRQQQQR